MSAVIPYSEGCSAVPLLVKVMREHNITSLPVSAPPGKWLGAGGTNIVDDGRQYIVRVTCDEL